MGMSLLSIIRRSVLMSKQSSMAMTNVPKGHFAVYIGEEQKKRLVVPISYLNHQWFKDLLSCSKEKFGTLIQWVASPFHALKRLSLVSVLVYIPSNVMANMTEPNSSILCPEELKSFVNVLFVF